tara:strand:- start:5179 stop:6486 length:1308 start_codon:yes stop_codon:yes gene_type:complete
MSENSSTTTNSKQVESINVSEITHQESTEKKESVPISDILEVESETNNEDNQKITTIPVSNSVSETIKQQPTDFIPINDKLVTLQEVSEKSSSDDTIDTDIVDKKTASDNDDNIDCLPNCPCSLLQSIEVLVEDETAKNKAYNDATESIYDSSLIIDSYEFDYTVTKLREFFKGLGFLEAHPQNRLSILAACEDPFTVAKFDYANKIWPLPQTGQMWLEYELLKNPSAKGYFCLSTSYRQEQTPVEGRHDLIFPLFEFEMHGGIDVLISMEKDLLRFLGYDETKFVEGEYNDIAKEYGVEELENEQESALAKDKSPTFFLKDFPESTDPFWNMRRYDGDKKDIAKKVDVILSGQETFGSAEREVDIDVMRERFNTISGGGYKKKLYDLFGKERTDKEMDDYFKFNFFERCGGGIGMTRLIRSLKTEGLMPEFNKN